MKKTMKALLLGAALALSSVFCTGCGADGTQRDSSASVWDSALYTEDRELGEGALTLKVEVAAEEKSVTFTIHTDEDTLGAALIENDLVSGEESEFGLYIKFVNGIEADFDKDGSYWSLSKDGEYLMQGADSTAIADGEHYELTRVKE